MGSGCNLLVVLDLVRVLAILVDFSSVSDISSEAFGTAAWYEVVSASWFSANCNPVRWTASVKLFSLTVLWLLALAGLVGGGSLPSYISAIDLS